MNDSKTNRWVGLRLELFAMIKREVDKERPVVILFEESDDFELTITEWDDWTRDNDIVYRIDDDYRVLVFAQSLTALNSAATQEHIIDRTKHQRELREKFGFTHVMLGNPTNYKKPPEFNKECFVKLGYKDSDEIAYAVLFYSSTQQQWLDALSSEPLEPEEYVIDWRYCHKVFESGDK